MDTFIHCCNEKRNDELLVNIKETNKALTKWANLIVKDARSNAAREFGSDSNLASAIDSEVKASKNSIRISFTPGYATFPDLGVRGNTGILKDGRRSSPYQYRDKMPPTSALDTFVLKKLKGLKRNEKGQIMSRKSLKFAVAKNIQKFGIKQTLFFTRPFEKYFKQLPEYITQAFGEDVAKYYVTAFKDSVSDQFKIAAEKAKKFN